MPRVEHQDIPPALSLLYNTILAPTVPVVYPGGQSPGLNQNVKKHYPRILEPPNIPTASQLEQRAIFRAALDCWNLLNVNEEEAWYSLGVEFGMNPFVYFMHYVLPPFGLGLTCTDFHMPRCSPFDINAGDPFGSLSAIFNYSASDRFHFLWKLTWDPIEYENEWSWATAGLGYSIHYWIDPPGEWSAPNFQPFSDILDRTTAALRTTWLRGIYTRFKFTIWLSGTNPTPCVLWKWFPEEVPCDYEAENFWVPLE